MWEQDWQASKNALQTDPNLNGVRPGKQVLDHKKKAKGTLSSSSCIHVLYCVQVHWAARALAAMDMCLRDGTRTRRPTCLRLLTTNWGQACHGNCVARCKHQLQYGFEWGHERFVTEDAQ